MLRLTAGTRSVELFIGHEVFIGHRDGKPIAQKQWEDLVESDTDLEWDAELAFSFASGSEVKAARMLKVGGATFSYWAGRVRIMEPDEGTLLKAGSLAAVLGAVVYDDQYTFDGAERILRLDCELWPGAPQEIRGPALELALEVANSFIVNPELSLSKVSALPDSAEAAAFAAGVLVLVGRYDPDFVADDYPHVLRSLQLLGESARQHLAHLAQDRTLERYCESRIARLAFASQ